MRRSMLLCLLLSGCFSWAFADGSTTSHEDVNEMVCREACARVAHERGDSGSTGWTEGSTCGCRFDDGSIIHNVPMVPNQ